MENTLSLQKKEGLNGSIPLTASIHNQRSELVLAGEHKYLLLESAG